MTDYTYTNLDRMRDAIANSDWMDVGRVDPETIAAGYRYFDEWLAEHDRQTAEIAWDNAIEFFEDCFYGEVTSANEHNPFRKDTNA